MTAYIEAVRTLTRHMEQTQAESIGRGAALISEALLAGQALFCHELGHGLQGDFVQRAGGMAALRRFSFKLDLQDDVAPRLRDRPRAEPVDRVRETVRLALRVSQVRAGDVMLLGSVSGRNVAPVELALACRDAGVRTIGFTSLAYTSRVRSLHPSGLRLADVAEVIIDNGAPCGDAAVSIPGYESEVLPLSGIGTLLAGWLLLGEAMRRMAAAGRPATVFRSVNRENGEAHLRESMARYEEKGY